MKREFAYKFNKLPHAIQEEILNYIEQLFIKYKKSISPKKKKNAFGFGWENGLSDLKDQFTSVELQHKINEWR
ncbi:MAG TPA: DUF2281 domain-containing protein [Bacteroidia bacterium]|nr:DUF2281 domain-containing protein [Bacteroidia bacterium]